ncbi:sigma-70 family RNA polymerase sigma factor [Corallococcus sp. AB049A]|uniref:sigma-70 family RNA polymerase sigma factor n=1 Tax=Corallococcus sp. AB049A TaxID=2316721 RepID=UPI000ECBE689|nr:sigma-70 family RNA polymerase sigma factor [Corallococcus sp. AB049A]RKI72891.1 sigma-70 family RNA polymerase sigma factor [Corallococcus sp. AB049A]
MSTESQDPLGDAVKASWRRFLDTYEPLRPDLYRYCRQLTRSPWDAEDMAQETMARAFASLGIMAEPPRSPRAWLFRVASNLWLNRMRQAREVPAPDGMEVPEPATRAEPRATREAAGTLLSQLSPQERAAVVLKDAFGMSLEETAEALSTTTGAIKAALHRGRAKLVTQEPAEPAPVAPAVLDAFCDAFNARDLDRLTALLLDTATLEYPGFKLEYGARAVRDGSFLGTLFGCPEGGYVLVDPPRCELRAHRGESLFLWWSGEEVHAVVRVELDGDRIARLRNYYHAPEVLTEVCRELDVPFRTHGYHPAASP